MHHVYEYEIWKKNRRITMHILSDEHPIKVLFDKSRFHLNNLNCVAKTVICSTKNVCFTSNEDDFSQNET